MRGFLVVVLLFVLPGTAVGQEVPWGALPHVDAAELSDSVKARALSLMKKERSYWGCDKTVFVCATKARPHPVALRMAGFIVRQVARGKSDADIRQAFAERARSASPLKSADIQVDASRCDGPEDAEVTVVAFADFECPFCRKVSPLVRKLVKSRDRVRYCFKLFPVKGHGDLAVETSKMGWAAAELGAFWAFHDHMYEHFEAHEPEQMRTWFDSLGADWDKFVSLAESRDAVKGVGLDKREGLKLGVKSTPALFINGKRYYGEKSETELRDRIEEELEIRRDLLLKL